MKAVWKYLATCLGIGLVFPLAPGTVVSALIVLIYKFVLFRLGWVSQALILIVVFFVGVISASRFSAEIRIKDPRCVVIDEACGQLAALFLCPASWGFMLAAFVLFRFFDIFKPYPIRKLEDLPTGWGIMADDLAGGIFAGILINLYVLLR
jgi:phosphatidylglycerophosphatase A